MRTPRPELVWGGGGRLVEDDGGVQAEAGELREGAADAVQGGGVDCCCVADLDDADVEVVAGRRWGGAGVGAGLGEGGLFEVFEDGGGGGEAFQVGAGFALGGG